MREVSRLWGGAEVGAEEAAPGRLCHFLTTSLQEVGRAFLGGNHYAAAFMDDQVYPVLSCREAVELERRVLRGDVEREWEAMGRAGASLAEAVLRDYREIGALLESPAVLVLAGKGHNAGDAFLAADELLKSYPSARIDVLFALGENALNPLAERAWRRLLEAAGNSGNVRFFNLDLSEAVGAQLTEWFGRQYQVFLDGLFGMNFRPPFRAPMEEVVSWLNSELRADLRASVDLPSGLSDAETDVAIRADFSYMTGSAKRPLFEIGNAEWMGRLRYLDLGFFREERAEVASRTILLPEVLQPLRALRGTMTHKRKYGHVVIIGGSRRMPGAILMSILAAVRSGVGLVTAVVPDSLVPSLAAVAPEAMWIGSPETEEGGLGLDGLHLMESAIAKADAVLLGPGVGIDPETQALIEELVRKIDVSLVMDAEALQRRVIDRVARRKELRGKVVVTPHLGEFSRISGDDFSEVGEDGLLRFCRDSGVFAVLKGPPFTRICDGERIAYALEGGPILARGGSGDILAGILGSQVARSPERIVEAARRAVVWHGLAAEALARENGQEAVRTTQLLEHLSRVIRGEGTAS